MALGAALALLITIMLVNTLTTHSVQVEPGVFEPLAVDEQRAVEHLREAVRLQTISFEDPTAIDGAAFEAFQALLERSYPRVHETLEREIVGGRSLLYRWPGADPEAAPIILTAHIDVVPIAAPEAWTHPPFAAELAEGFVWGRGTMDDKGALIAIFEAAEAMLEAGLSPPRTVYLAFGHDEELTGLEGAGTIAERLHERGVEAALVLDEGLAITVGIVPAVDAPVAIIGLGEKGVANLELRVETEGGHASSPPAHTAIGVLAAAIARLEDTPMPATLHGPFAETLESAGPEMRWPLRLVATNMWLLRPLLGRVLGADPKTASAVRTTTAVTVVDGGVKVNVLPNTARALVNHRINYGDTIDGVIAHVREAVDDPRVEIELVHGVEVSNISDPTDPTFTTLARCLREVHPEVVVVPGLFVAASDARHYERVSKHVYRQSLFYMAREDVPRFHGVDERLAVEDFMGMIQFYARVLQSPPE